MTLRLTDEQDALLTRLADSQGISKNEAAVRAIRDLTTRLEKERAFDDALVDTMKRYPETIRRLGE